MPAPNTSGGGIMLSGCLFCCSSVVR